MYSIYKTRGFINHENLPDKDQWGQTPVAPAQSAALFAAGLPLAACDRTVSWSTSDAQVATVSEDGSVTGVAAGTATIIAETEGGLRAEALVTVREETIERDGFVVKNGVWTSYKGNVSTHLPTHPVLTHEKSPLPVGGGESDHLMS